jgi:hypothetical protein
MGAKEKTAGKLNRQQMYIRYGFDEVKTKQETPFTWMLIS